MFCADFQVCDWLYPLMATDSPVLLCNTGVYMFPDLMAPSPGSYVGVVLSSELPLAERELFQDVLSQLTDLRVQVSLYGSVNTWNRNQMVHWLGWFSLCINTAVSTSPAEPDHFVFYDFFPSLVLFVFLKHLFCFFYYYYQFDFVWFFFIFIFIFPFFFSLSIFISLFIFLIFF